MRVGFPWLPVALAATALLTAGRADAQQWLSDRARAEGRGIRLGDFELHPGIGSEIGWVSNVFLADQAQDSAVLRISPHLYLSTIGGSAAGSAMGSAGSASTTTTEAPVAFRAGASGTFKTYFGNGPDNDPDMGVGQDARLTLRPGRIFRAEIFEDYRRTIDPFTDSGSAAATTAAMGGMMGTVTPNNQLNYDRDLLGVGTRLQLSTPGGLFKVGVGYRFDMDKFEKAAQFGTNDNIAHTISADNSWEFLPKTALIWNGSVRLHNYTDAIGSRAARNNSTDVASSLGINGALTSRLGATLSVGYGAFFSADNVDYDTVAAQVEVRWKLDDNALWAVGYDRQINPSFQGNFARLDRVKTRLQALVSGALLLALRGEVTFLAFGADPLDGTQGPRRDIHLLTNLSGEYRFVDWLAATAEVGYIRNFTDYVFTGTNNKASYDQFAAFVGLRAFL